MSLFKHVYIAVGIMALSAGFHACSAGTMGMEGDAPGIGSMKDWKWYENKQCTLYSRTGTGENPIQKHNVSLPFFEGTGSAACDLFRINPEDVDMYPDDGWVLVSADFGTKDKAPVIPYFMLYNRATGILRYIFFYDYDKAYTHALVKLEQGQGQTLMFTFYDNADCFVDGKDAAGYNADKSLSTVTRLSTKAWNYADFVISYDPTITETEDLCFTIKVFGVNNSDVSLSGGVGLDYVTANRQLHSSTMTAGDVLSTGRKAVDYYKSVDEFIESCEASAGQWYSGILNRAGTTLDAGGTFGTVAGELAGIVSSGIFGGKNSRPVPLNFTGTLTLAGTITENNLIDSFMLSIPGTQISNKDSSNLSFYTKPLGIFSIKSKPVVDMTVKTTETFIPGIEGGENNSSSSWSFDLNVTSVKLTGGIFPEILFNNIEGYYVHTVEAGFVFSNEECTSRPLYDTQTAPFRLHKNNQVRFYPMDLFRNYDLNYNDETYNYNGIENPRDQWSRGWFYYQDFTDDDWKNTVNIQRIKIDDVKIVANVVAPEIAIKVILYSVKDTEKKNPIIHIKRVRADYNLYWHHIRDYEGDSYLFPVETPIEGTDNLGFFTN